MRNYNGRPSFRERFARFMMGRYGIDKLYYFLIGVYFILIVISFFVRHYILFILESIVLFYSIYRVMSRNIYKRQQENEKFLKIINKPKKIAKLQKCKKRDRKTHVYKKCPSCRNNLRLPKEKGKHTVVCPCCKHRFDIKI